MATKTRSLYAYGKLSIGLEIYRKKADGELEEAPYKVYSIFKKDETGSARPVEEIELGRGQVELGSRAVRDYDGGVTFENLVDIASHSREWFVLVEEDAKA